MKATSMLQNAVPKASLSGKGKGCLNKVGTFVLLLFIIIGTIAFWPRGEATLEPVVASDELPASVAMRIGIAADGQMSPLLKEVMDQRGQSWTKGESIKLYIPASEGFEGKEMVVVASVLKQEKDNLFVIGEDGEYARCNADTLLTSDCEFIGNYPIEDEPSIYEMAQNIVKSALEKYK